MSTQQINNWQDLRELLITNPAAAIGLALATVGSGVWNMWQSVVSYLSVGTNVQFMVGLMGTICGVVLVIFTIWEKWLQIKKLKRIEREEARYMKEQLTKKGE